MKKVKLIGGRAHGRVMMIEDELTIVKSIQFKRPSWNPPPYEHIYMDDISEEQYRPVYLNGQWLEFRGTFYMAKNHFPLHKSKILLEVLKEKQLEETKKKWKTLL